MFNLSVSSKYEPKQQVMLDPEGIFFSVALGPKIKFEKMPLWIKGLKLSEKQKMVFTWS